MFVQDWTLSVKLRENLSHDLMSPDLQNLKFIISLAMASHSSTLAWKIPWMEEPGGLQSMRSLRVRYDWATNFHFSLSCIGEGSGNPLQCSCLENPRDRGAWWAAVYGVAQSRTRLKWLSSSSLPLGKYSFLYLSLTPCPCQQKVMF